jgi:hypothetical protein
MTDTDVLGEALKGPRAAELTLGDAHCERSLNAKAWYEKAVRSCGRHNDRALVMA